MSKEEKIHIPSLDLSGCNDVKQSLETNPISHFPSKRYRPYPHQQKALQLAKAFFSEPTERIMLLYISTAGGKTALALSFAKSWTEGGGVSVIICPNKELQGQYEKDFGKDDISIVKGASSFRCQTNPNIMCGSVVARKACSLRKMGDERIPLNEKPCECPYQMSKKKAAIESKEKALCFTPHSYFAFKKNKIFSDFLPDGNGLMIVDEAHLLPDLLASMLTVSIRLDLINDLLNHSDTNGDSFQDSFLGPVKERNVNHDGQPLVKLGINQTAYLEGLLLALNYRESLIDTALKDRDDEMLSSLVPALQYIEDTEKYNKYQDLIASLRDNIQLILATASETEWACELTTNSLGSIDFIIPQNKRGGELRLLIRPGIIPLSFLKTFFRGYSKVMLLSGTLFPDHLRRLGLVSKENTTEEGTILGASIYEAESTIAPERRKMYIDLVHGMNVNHKNIDEAFQKFAKFIVGGICPKFPGEKGMIHVASSYQAEKLARFCNIEALRRYKRLSLIKGAKVEGPIAKFITPEANGWDKTFKSFKASKVGGKYGENLFLIAARRFEGIDLADDLCRINIIAKAPFPNSKDTIVCSLDSIFPTYSVVTTITSFIQAANRAVRHPKDWAFNICLDTSMKSIIDRFLDDMPSYVKDAIEYMDDLTWVADWEKPDSRKKKGFFEK